MKVLLAAEESAGAHALRLVARAGYTVAGVLTSRDEAEGSVHAIARGLEIQVLDPALVRGADFAGWVGQQQVDLFLNVHSLHIAHPAVLDAPRAGSFNLHPGPLPRYAGLNAPSWAIYLGEPRHAVTLHWMTGTVDAGDIAYEAWFDIGPRDTGLKVATNCVRHGLPLIEQLLEDAATGRDRIPARPQDPRERRWFGRAAPHGGRLAWDEPARRVVDLVRAASYAPYPSPWGWPRGRVDGVEVEVVRVAPTGDRTAEAAGTIGPEEPGGVRVAAADEWVAVERLRSAGVTVAPREVLRPGRRFDPLPHP